MARAKESTHRLFSSTGIPLYVQLAELLRRRVRNGALAPGAMLPPIPAMMREFKVARVTVRQAVRLLTADGLLSPQRGRGTFVTDQAGMQRGLRLTGNLDELVEMYRGDRPELATLSCDVALPSLKESDGVAADAYMHIRRVHSRGGERYCVISVFVAMQVYEMAPRRFREELVLEVLSSLSSVVITSGRQDLRISGADPETASLLGIPINTPMADVRRILRDADGMIVYVADVTYRGDTIQLEMELRT